MRSCIITFRIKDYFPKLSNIPFEEYACLFVGEDFNEKIPLIEKDFNICKHQVNNINSDLKYKVHLVSITDYSLIGMCEIVIPYSIIAQIDIPGSFIKEQQLKLFTDLKTKRKLFGTIISPGDIYLYISAEVYVNNQNNIDRKKKNFIKNKNFFNKEHNKIIFGNSIIDFNNNNRKYRIIKTDKDSLRNECKTYTCLKNITNSNTNNTINNDLFYAPLSQERKERQINKFQSNPSMVEIKNNLTIDNNKNKKNPKIKKIQTQRKKLTILDLMEQKFSSKRQFNNKMNNALNKNMNINNNTFCKSSSPKEFKKLNIENKENIELNNFFSYKPVINNNDNNNNIITKNTFSPVNNKNILINDKINYIYKKKSAQKIRTKLSENKIFNINSSPYSTSIYNVYGGSGDNNGNSVFKKTKSCSSTKIQIQNQNSFYRNSNNNNTNIYDITENNFILSSKEKQQLKELDKSIFEKGALLKNDFQNQFSNSNNQSKYFLESTCDDIYNISNRNSTKNINENMNARYNRSQKDFHKLNINYKTNSPHMKIELDTSKNNTNNITPCSSNQTNNIFAQDDLKNNILNLLEFYSLLKKKIDIVKENLDKNKKKLIIKKEKFNHQLKKNNRLTQKIISSESKIILHATVNCALNEQVILPLMKIKKIESNVYKNIFGLSCHDYDVMKFREKEKNKLFEEQNIMHLLLIIIKNMVEHYGNISHIYNNDTNKKKKLNLLLLKYEINEKKEANNNITENQYKTNFNKSPYLTRQIIDDDFLNKFKIIREVEEDKEYSEEEEEKNKTDIHNENIIENFNIEDYENNINKKEEKQNENGATINENEKSEKKPNGQYLDGVLNDFSFKNDIINKILFEDFPKKYPNENKFVLKNKNEYIFGDNIVNVEMNNNDLEFLVNNEKYNLDTFLKYFSNNKNIKDKIKEEQINGIESTAVDSDKSEKVLKDKNDYEKIFAANVEEFENDESYSCSTRKQKRMKRKISIENEKEKDNQSFKDLKNMKNGAESNEFKEK